MNIELLKQNGINLEAALENLGDMDMYNDIANDFLTESKDRLPNIKKYLEESDIPNYAILVHAMKSDSKYLGFSRLAELSYEHEMSSKEGNIAYVQEHFNELMEEANRIITILQQYLEG